MPDSLNTDEARLRQRADPSRIRLSVLDFCVIDHENNGSSVDALWASIEMARRADELGYHRYWLAEHYSQDVGHSSPEVMLAAIAGNTDRIRVGTAGILLKYQYPMKLAQMFRALNALFPGRVDLGLARAHAGFVDDTLQQAESINRPSSGPDDQYRTLLTQLLGFLNDRPFRINPVGVSPPVVWVLGTGGPSAALAGETGTAFCTSLFIGQSDRGQRAAVATYCKTFVPSAFQSLPMFAVALAGVCRESEEKARQTVRTWGPGVRPSVVGNVRQCNEQLARICDEFETNDLVFLDCSSQPSQRMETYELLADVCRLRERADSEREASAGS